MGNILRTYTNIIVMEFMSEDYFGYQELIDESEGDLEMVQLDNKLNYKQMLNSVNIKKWDNLYEASIIKNNTIRLK